MQDREPKYSEEYIQDILSDIYNVGSQKPLGYLPIDTLEDICGVKLAKAEEDLKMIGLKTLRLNRFQSRVADRGALYVYDHDTLAQLLSDNITTLNEYGWPHEPESFIRMLKISVPEKNKLYDLIADAYNDKTNIGRTDVDDPDM